MTIGQMRNVLEETLSPHRFAHSVGVAETAKALATLHGADAQKAYLAGLLHDCAKRYDGGALLRYAQEAKMPIDRVECASPGLLHARIGRRIAGEEFGVLDGDVLDAIEHHIYGIPGMPLLDMLINIADYTEPGRDFPGVKEIRELSLADPSAALACALRGSMQHILHKGSLLHPGIVLTYNDLLLRAKESSFPNHGNAL